MLSHAVSQPLVQRLARGVLWFMAAGLIGLLVAPPASELRRMAGIPDIPAPWELPALALGGLTITAGWRGMRRTAEPAAHITHQLGEAARAASLDALRLQTVAEGGPAAAGWNRLVELVRHGSRGAGLEHRLADALAGLQHQKADRILNGLTDGVAVTDTEGRITFANRALKVLVGRPEGDLAGRFIDEILPWQEQPHPDATRRTLREHGQPLVLELRRSADVTDGVLRVARTPLVGDERDPKSSLWSVRDVTQQKLAEAARSHFVDSASHELRTPLANIKAYAETLTLGDELDGERQKEFVNVINAEATRLARFVDDLLDVSRMEAGSLSLDRQETDMERLLAETVEKVRPQMAQKQIALDVSVPPKLPELRIDKDKIAAALVNLLGNAAKYTPDGGRVKLVVECDGRELHIHVEDTGIGISAEEISKLGTKFFRSGDPRVRDITGSGLGLSFAQEAVRLHGGRLQITSELNRGSRFSVVLPVA